MYKIIQSSPPHTGSTVLVNLLYGFLLPNEPVKFNDFSGLITKTHDTKISHLEKNYSKYKLFFVTSERYDYKVKKKINHIYKNKKNVLIINYNEINETDNNSLDNIIEKIFHKFKNFLPKELIPNKEDKHIKNNMKKRIVDMNNLYKKIKNKPFSYYDNFYHIHGSHRNRK
jgi:hypothetical protein